jgi:hypothetical protein
MKNTIALLAALALLPVTGRAQSPTPTPTPSPTPPVTVSIQPTPAPAPAPLVVTLSGSDTQSMLVQMLTFISTQLTAEGQTLPTLPPVTQVKRMVASVRTAGGGSRTVIQFFPAPSTTGTSGT